MREFFREEMNEYVPTDRDFTAEFGRAVLSGEK